MLWFKLDLVLKHEEKKIKFLKHLFSIFIVFKLCCKASYPMGCRIWNTGERTPFHHCGHICSCRRWMCTTVKEVDWWNATVWEDITNAHVTFWQDIWVVVQEVHLSSHPVWCPTTQSRKAEVIVTVNQTLNEHSQNCNQSKKRIRTYLIFLVKDD